LLTDGSCHNEIKIGSGWLSPSTATYLVYTRKAVRGVLFYGSVIDGYLSSACRRKANVKGFRERFCNIQAQGVDDISLLFINIILG
jgi:hypothetical protein